MSASTVRTTMRLGEAAIAELRRLERERRAARGEEAERRVAERAAEYAERGAAEAAVIGEIAGRLDALEGELATTAIERARQDVAAAGDEQELSAARERVAALERQADVAFATATSQKLALAELVERTGIENAPGATWRGDSFDATLELGAGERMPISIRTVPAGSEAEIGVEQQVIFRSANSNIDQRMTPQGLRSACEEQHARVEDLVGAFGPGLQLDDPPPGGAAASGERSKAAARGRTAR